MSALLQPLAPPAPPPFQAIADLVRPARRGASAAARAGAGRAQRHLGSTRRDGRSGGGVAAARWREAATAHRDLRGAIRWSTWPCSSAGCARGVAVAPLPTSALPAQQATMLADSGARHFFVDRAVPDVRVRRAAHLSRRQQRADRWSTGWRRRARGPNPSRCSPTGPSTSSIRRARPARPRASCSRTPCAGRHVARAESYGYGPEAVTLIATSLCSNTTLVCFFPTIASGGCVVLAPPKFDAGHLSADRRTRTRHAHHAGAGAVPAPDGAAAIRRLRPVVVPA